MQGERRTGRVEPGLQIPDAGTVVTSPLQVSQEGLIEDLRVQVRIRHTFIGDLRVDLVAPDGSAVVLHNKAGGSDNDLRRTYSVAELPALRGLLGKPVTGMWQLRVVDAFRQDKDGWSVGGWWRR